MRNFTTGQQPCSKPQMRTQLTLNERKKEKKRLCWVIYSISQLTEFQNFEGKKKKGEFYTEEI